MPRTDRFLVSADGMLADWFATPNAPANWHDCTDMGVEELQRFVAERQAVRPYIVGVAMGDRLCGVSVTCPE
jgi:hypothetical protein